MSLLDWSIVIIPLAFVMFVGFYSRRYIRDVADFLTAGRVCGRYVISVADMASALSVIGVVAYVEVQYRTGFALAFWNNLLLPILILMGLTGYCTYRFRETRAMSIGQFLEMRYSRGLRIFAALLRSTAEILSNAILPAVAARFFIYFLDLPERFEFCGITFGSFALLMAGLLLLALALIWMGGTLALITTDAVQGMFCLPLMALFAGFVLWKFSWQQEIVPVMLDRVPGESFLNPFDVEQLRDFNVFALILTIWVAVFHRASWIGSGNSSAAKSAHEQKMAGLLGMWRSSLMTVFYVLFAAAMLTLLNHSNYAPEARDIRAEISRRVAAEVAPSAPIRAELEQRTAVIPEQRHRIGADPARSEAVNADTVYLKTAQDVLGDQQNGNIRFQEFRTLYHQLMLPVAMRRMLPPVLLGCFCLLMVLAMLSTDTGRIFGASLTLAQDVVLVLRKKPFSPESHIRMVRYVSLGVTVCFFIGSLFLAQLDYINLFVTLASMIWLCGCGPVMIFGLYSRRGTTAGAWGALLGGAAWALGSLFVQRNWADLVYPFLVDNDCVRPLGFLLEILSAPLHPYVVWKMDAVKCPVNSYELYFIGMLFTLALYVGLSLLTCRKPFNLDKMLNRNQYAVADDHRVPESKAKIPLLVRMVGVSPEYSRSDRWIAWGFFLFSFIYTFLGSFLAVLIWNVFSPWPLAWWGAYFRVVSVIVPGTLALLTAIWFCCGGIRDLFRLFRDLETRKRNDADDGRVS